MPRNDWDSALNRYVTDTLIDCAAPPVNNNDLVNKLYCDTTVGGAAIFMSQYANPQAAVAAAIASGVNAIFVDDMFTITAPVNINGATLALIGLGKDTGFIVNAAAATGALNISVADVLIQNFHVEMTQCAAAAACVLANNADNLTARSISIHVPVGQVVASGFDLQNSANLRLLNCDVEVAGTCTVAAYLTDAHCPGFIIHDCYASGSVDGVNTDSAYGKISKCTIAAVTAEGIQTLAAATHCHIVDNHVDTCGGSGIIVAAVDSLVENNNLGTLTANGIQLSTGADDCIVRGNRIATPGAAAEGIFLEDCDTCVVSGNRISNCPGNGIELAGVSTRNVIEGNSESGCAAGILLANTCDHNLVVGNQVPSGLAMGTAVNNQHAHNMV